MADKQYAVFLSFNSEDRKMVEKIAVYLKDKTDLRPWFDQWDLIPGEPWVRNLEKGLKESSACAVFVGKSGEGPWQSREVETALRQQVDQEDFRVIPVLLPDALKQPELPLFLAGNMWIDFRGKGIVDDDTLWRLECGIRGVAPGQGRPGSPPKEERRKPPAIRRPSDPLMNFEEELAVFEKIATEEDTETRLILIHGPGGTGKTRLLEEYNRIAQNNNLNVLSIPLNSQSTIEKCLYEIVCCFGIGHFPSWNEFRKSGRPEPLTRTKEVEWLENLTVEFFTDLNNYPQAPRLVIFFDQYEKADRDFTEWLIRSFLPGLFSQPLIVVVAGRDEVEQKPSWHGQHHFSLKGVEVEWYQRYAETFSISIDLNLLNELHKFVNGRPKEFVEYIKAQTAGGVQ